MDTIVHPSKWLHMIFKAIPVVVSIGRVPMNDLLTVNVNADVRHQWIWTAAELDSLAWAVGDSAWRLSLPGPVIWRSFSCQGDVAGAMEFLDFTRRRGDDGMDHPCGWPHFCGRLSVGVDLGFPDPLVRESEGHLMLDLVLSDVVEGGSMSLLGMAVGDTLGQTCAPSNPHDSSEWMETTAWKSTCRAGWFGHNLDHRMLASRQRRHFASEHDVVRSGERSEPT